MNTHRRDRLEAENAELIEMLDRLNDPIARELADRMRRCRADRVRRREGGFSTVVEVMRAPQYKCKAVACWACRTAHIGRKKEQAMEVFASAANEDCSFVTVNAAAPSSDLDEVAALHRKFATDLNNLRDALARRHSRFNRLAAYAVLEVEYDATGMWKAHWHLCLWHERVDRQEVAEAFRRQWQGDRRVNVKPFDVTEHATSNARAITGYALKFHHGQWPIYAVALLWLWLRQRAALRSLCVRMNRRVQQAIHLVQPETEPIRYIEPMPVVV